MTAFRHAISRLMKPLFTVLMLAAVMVAPQAYAQTAPAPAPKLLPDMTKGNPKAKVTVIEYGSATCGHCAAWYSENWADFDERFLKTGKVKYVFREVITPPADLDYSVFMIARCASEKANPKKPDTAAYFTVVEGFWRVQHSVYQTRDYVTPLKILGAKGGLSNEEISACTQNKERFADLSHSMKTRNEADKVTSTPTFFVNGKRVEGESLEEIGAAIDAAKPAR